MTQSIIKDKSITTGYVMLLMTAAMWGTAFFFQKNATEHVDAFAFNFLRFVTAIPTLFLLYLFPKKLFVPDVDDIPKQKRFHHSAWFIGGGAGIFMFLGISLQQWGLSFTTAGKSGFLTGLYIIIVPILALAIGQRCRIEVWIGAIITFIGVYLLGSVDGDSAESKFNIGDVMTLICAFAWAAQVLWLGAFARYANVLSIAIIQMVVVASLSGSVMMLFWLTQEGGGYALPSWETIMIIKMDIFYTGVISAAVAFTLQILGQRLVPATNAALIMSMEAVFALLAGVILLNEIVTPMALLGCACIMAGIILAQLQGKVFSRRSHNVGVGS
ncbi:MAG: DMT family transporter [Gammaproteobacteria bacterium]|nr:DMT family transporter [Gammaproteobacteria bacterium]